MENTIIIVLIGFIGGLIPIITPILKLNSSIVKLDTTIKNILDDNLEIKGNVRDNTTKINNHETRITVLENKKEVS